MSMTALAIGAGVAGLAGGLINSFNNKGISDSNLRLQRENLDYQKHVQQETWNREDTAMQRRVQDLKSAGLNPYLAQTGSGAGAGSIVSTQAPQQQMYESPFGSVASSIQQGIGQYLDMTNALEQIKQNKLYTEYLNLQNAEAFNNFAFNWADSQGRIRNFRKSGSMDDLLDTNMGKVLNQKVQDVLNQGYLLQRDRDFYIADKIESYILDSIDAFGKGASAYRKISPFVQDKPLMKGQTTTYGRRSRTTRYFY